MGEYLRNNSKMNNNWRLLYISETTDSNPHETATPQTGKHQKQAKPRKATNVHESANRGCYPEITHFL